MTLSILATHPKQHVCVCKAWSLKRQNASQPIYRCCRSRKWKTPSDFCVLQQALTKFNGLKWFNCCKMNFCWMIMKEKIKWKKSLLHSELVQPLSRLVYSFQLFFSSLQWNVLCAEWWAAMEYVPLLSSMKTRHWCSKSIV